MSEPFFSEEFSSDFESMATVLERVLAALRLRLGLEGAAASRIRLCIEEALVNAIRHGNHSDPGRSVRISAMEEHGWCSVQVCDEGRGFCPGRITVPNADRLGGRGLCLIRHYMDDVEFLPDEGCLIMRFRSDGLKEGA